MRLCNFVAVAIISPDLDRRIRKFLREKAKANKRGVRPSADVYDMKCAISKSS